MFYFQILAIFDVETELIYLQENIKGAFHMIAIELQSSIIVRATKMLQDRRDRTELMKWTILTATSAKLTDYSAR